MGLIITLLVLGLLLIIAEMTVIPGFGITGILGLASFIGAIVMAFSQFGNTVGFIVLFAALVLCGILLFLSCALKPGEK